jgi:hypothetical protein
LQGLVGLNGISLPQQIHVHLGPLRGLLQSFVSASTDMSAHEFALAMAWLGVLLLTALLLPNTLELTARYEPALGVRSAGWTALARSTDSHGSLGRCDVRAGRCRGHEARERASFTGSSRTAMTLHFRPRAIMISTHTRW